MIAFPNIIILLLVYPFSLTFTSKKIYRLSHKRFSQSFFLLHKDKVNQAVVVVLRHLAQLYHPAGDSGLGQDPVSVSYTHLTLPTILLV